MNGNGSSEVGWAELRIRWNPSTNQLQVMFPQIGDVANLGLLEMAKLALADMRSKADQRITLPSLAMKEGLKI